jgi:addiction module RelB/DinJ family antitoxin
MSDAINAFLSQIRLNHGMPFELTISNKLTKETMDKSHKGIEVKRFDSVEDLFDDLIMVKQF